MSVLDSMLEIEQKFIVDDPENLVQNLLKIGATQISVIWQKDDYFNHPNRDFSETDEAFRIRYQGLTPASDPTSKSDCDWQVTYKGPKEPGTVKIREEIEVPLCQQLGDYQQWLAILEKLSFRFVGSVEKKRENWSVGHSENNSSDKELMEEVIVTIDRVTDLGTFAEIEVVTRRDQIDSAEQKIWNIAERLQLDKPVRKSYLRQILKLREAI